VTGLDLISSHITIVEIYNSQQHAKVRVKAILRGVSGFFNEQIQRVWPFRDALASEAWIKAPRRCQRTKDFLLQLRYHEDSDPGLIHEAREAIANDCTPSFHALKSGGLCRYSHRTAHKVMLKDIRSVSYITIDLFLL